MSYPKRKEPHFMFLLLLIIIIFVIVFMTSLGDVTGTLDLKKYSSIPSEERLIYFNAPSSRNIATMNYIYTDEKIYVEQIQKHINNIVDIDIGDTVSLYNYEYGIDLTDTYVPPTQYGICVHPSMVLYTPFDPSDTNMTPDPPSYNSELDISIVNNINNSLVNSVAFIRVYNETFYIKNVNLLTLQPHISKDSFSKMYIQYDHSSSMSLLDLSFSTYYTLLLTSIPSVIQFKETDLNKGYILHPYPNFNSTDTSTYNMIPTSQIQNPPKTIAFITIQLKAGDKLIIPPMSSVNKYSKYAFSTYPSSSSSFGDIGKIYTTPTQVVHLDQKDYYNYTASQDEYFEWGPIQ